MLDRLIWIIKKAGGRGIPWIVQAGSACDEKARYFDEGTIMSALKRKITLFLRTGSALARGSKCFYQPQMFFSEHLISCLKY